MRKVIPVNEGFFNDGHWYVISSSSLGGSGLGALEISKELGTEDEAKISKLIEDGICLPLVFEGDCVLDNVVFVMGDLTEREDAEWFGRVRAKLNIPCGEFLLMGGGMDEHFEEALPNFEPPDKNFPFFHKIKLEPGSYMVEVYGFLGSECADDELEEIEEGIGLQKWWTLTNPGRDTPEWISLYEEEEYVDAEELDLIDYIIRIVPSSEEVDVPHLEDESKWVDKFEIRRPEQCPVGLARKDLVTE